MTLIDIQNNSHTKEFTLKPRKIKSHSVWPYTQFKNGSSLNLEIFGVLQYLPLGIIRPRMTAWLGMERGYSYYIQA